MTNYGRVGSRTRQLANGLVLRPSSSHTIWFRLRVTPASWENGIKFVSTAQTLSPRTNPRSSVIGLRSDVICSAVFKVHFLPSLKIACFPIRDVLWTFSDVWMLRLKLFWIVYVWECIASSSVKLCTRRNEFSSSGFLLEVRLSFFS